MRSKWKKKKDGKLSSQTIPKPKNWKQNNESQGLRTTEHEPKTEDQIEDRKPKNSKPYTKITDHERKAKEWKPKIEGKQPKTADKRPQIKNHKPKIKDQCPKTENQRLKVEDYIYTIGSQNIDWVITIDLSV